MKQKLLNTKLLLLLSFFITVQISIAQNGIDSNFGQDGTVTTVFSSRNSYAETVIQLANNKLVVAGGAFNEVTGEEDIAIAKYLENGSIDTSFGSTGTIIIQLDNYSSYVLDMTEDSNNKILIAGVAYDSSDNFQAFLIRLNSNGTIDSSFGTNGKIMTNFGTTLEAGATAVAIQSDGKIILGGATLDYSNPLYDELGDFALARYNSNGTLDTSFGSGGYVITAFNDNYYDIIESIKVQADGKIIAAGYSGTEEPITFEDSSNIVIARFNTNGSLDSSFGTSGKKQIDVNTYDYIHGMALQSNGKILLAGDTYNGNSVDDSLIIRLNTNGSLDTSFSGDGIVTTAFLTGSIAYSSAASVIPNSDGTIIAAGTSSDDTNTEYITFARYTANGALDTTFRDDGKVVYEIDNAYINQAIVTSSSKLLVVGERNGHNNGNFEYHMFLAQFSLSNTLSIENVNAEFISVYPNPVSDHLNINFTTAIPNTQIILYDVLGKEVMTLNTDNKLEQINMHNLSQGLYYLNIVQENKVFTKKIVKN